MTHCCAKKDDSLRHTGRRVTPDRLYMATPTQRFMDRCKEKQVNWAIFSDLYGVWFPTEEEFQNLLDDFDDKLQEYDEVWFYYNPGRFHSLYERLLQETRLRDRMRRFTHIRGIL